MPAGSKNSRRSPERFPGRRRKRCGWGYELLVLQQTDADSRRAPSRAGRAVWRERSDQEASKALVSNRLGWEVSRIVRVDRHRWTGTETFHRDGKQQLGLGDCQLRGQGQTRQCTWSCGVQSPDARVAAGPCEGLGTPSADDHRRSLSGRDSRDRGAHYRLGGGQADRGHWSVPDIKAVLACS